MNYIRNTTAALVLLILLSFNFNVANATITTIYDTSTKQTLTSGATLEKIMRFTTEGWLAINVVRVDLSNPNIKVDTLTNSDSIAKLTSTLTLAKSKNAVAAINSSFFVWSNVSGLGSPIGNIVESGKVVSSISDLNQNPIYDTFANLSITNLNKVIYDYLKVSYTIMAPTGVSSPVARYNQVFQNYSDLSIIDRRMSQISAGTDTATGCADIVEMVVKDNKVQEIRESMPSVGIPVNGYVVESRLDGGLYLKNNFKVGDSVQLDMNTNFNPADYKTSVAGAALLVTNGKIPVTFSQNPPSGRHPRTAAGSTKDGKQMILVTVDGRQNNSYGMTMTELAELMLQLGAYNAINFDGGGSTTMVARDLKTQDINTINNPSDGSPRSISTALGVLSVGPLSKLDSLLIEAEDYNVFVNTSRAFTATGYDRYLNPVVINPSDIKWSVSGVSGSFVGNTFYPTTVGEATIKATIGTVSSTKTVSVLSSPVQLELDKKEIKLTNGQSASINVSGKNKNGYHAIINPTDIKWAVSGKIGSMNSNTFTASGSESGYIDASIGNTHAYCAVTIPSTVKKVIDAFEKKSGAFLTYPVNMGGSYGITTLKKHLGKFSGKLTYNLPIMGDTYPVRASYMIYNRTGLPLDPSTTTLGLWIYNNHINSTWVGAWVYDSKDKLHYVYFTKGMDWIGWKYVETSLEDIDSPSRIARIYTVQTEAVKDSGTLYIDDLTAIVNSPTGIDSPKVPKDTTPIDESNIAVSLSGTDTFSFSVFGETGNPSEKTTSQKTLMEAFSSFVNKNMSASAFVGDGTHSITSTIAKPFLATNIGNKTFDIKSSRFVQLDMSNQGLRSSSSSQWPWFLQQLNSFKGSNMFIFMEDNSQVFTDKLEGDLFRTILEDYKKKYGWNIWVVYKGTQNTSYMERGIKYITTAGFDEEGLDGASAKYLNVTVTGSKVTYQFKDLGK